MLVLFESAVGYAVFKLNDEKKLKETDNLIQEFQDSKKAGKLVKLEHFERFKDASEALTAITSTIEGKVPKKLKKMMKKVVVGKLADSKLALVDPKIGTSLKESFGLDCVATEAVQKLMTCIRSQIESLVPEWSIEEDRAMQLAISHGLGRYKLKFSPDKVDTMIVQAVSLLDDLDKELNNYVMRCKEWYGWHFPELSKIIQDNTAYIHCVLKIGMKTNAAEADLSEILPEEIEARVKEMAEVSMGTEITEMDLQNIRYMAQNVLDLQEYRTQLYEYLKKRMMAIAPNLTILVGEVVGARLISHAGSLINLAKHPASTVQILGAEKALFRALKAHHDTPKYGLIYHAQLIGQSTPKVKGKMSRMLAAKASLATRVDALGDSGSTALGLEHRAKLESRLRFLEEGGLRRISGMAKQSKPQQEKYQHKSAVHTFKAASDVTGPIGGDDGENKRSWKQEVKQEEGDDDEGVSAKKKKKKDKKKKSEGGSDATVAETSATEVKEEEEELDTSQVEGQSEKKKKKKDKKRKLIEEVSSVPEVPAAEVKQEEEEDEGAVGGEEAPKKKKKKSKK